MVGDTFKETATLRSDGMFYAFGVTPKLKELFGVKKHESIYEIEFEVVEEPAEYPVGHENNLIYFSLHENSGNYCLTQPNAEMFTMQFPYDVWKEHHRGVAVKVVPKQYSIVNE
jgi:hypothetical protein